MQFAGNVFLVTGGGAGIGRGIVRRLVSEGAKVCIVDKDRHAGRDAADEYNGEWPDHVMFVAGDCGKEPDVRKAIAGCARWGKRLDGVVHNAAIAAPDIGPIEKLSLATWQRYIDANLTSAFLIAKHATPHLRRTRGSIIHLGSTRAVMSEPHTEPYAASKGGIVALTHALAMSLGPDIRVNCVSPGWIATSELAPRDRRKPAKLSKADHAQHPVGRVGKPDDIAALCSWLLSSEAGFVTGQNFVSDGGMTRKMIYS